MSDVLAPGRGRQALQQSLAERRADAASRPVAVWLGAVALIVVGMVVVGGATRLTGSGLSITQWRPVSGIFPPMSQRQWADVFALYKATPQYNLVNRGMSLGQFQAIFWWEWAHRLLGRLVGVVFAVPLIVFLATRQMPSRLTWRCAALLGLGALQGAVGWWMVKSGLEARVSVAPERLATHLSLALFLFAALVWTALEAWFGPVPDRQRRDGWTRVGAVLLLAVFVQCLLGALVAGNQAGKIDTDWPLMAGAWFPSDYWGASPWATLVHSPTAVQFNHRVIAYLVLVFAEAIALTSARSRTAPMGLRRLGVLIGVLALVQVGLGVATLMSLVALPLALLHQATAVALLCTALAFAWRARRV